GVQNRGGDRQAGTGRSAGADPIAGQEDAALDRSEAAGVFDSVYVSWRRCDTGDKALELESGELCLWIAIVCRDIRLGGETHAAWRIRFVHEAVRAVGDP